MLKSTSLMPVIIMAAALCLFESMQFLLSAKAPALLPTITRSYPRSKLSTLLFFMRSTKTLVSPPGKYIRSEHSVFLAISSSGSEYSAKSTVLAPRPVKYSDSRFLRSYALSNDALAQGKTRTAGSPPASRKAISLISLESLFTMFSPPRKYSFDMHLIHKLRYFKTFVLSQQIGHLTSQFLAAFMLKSSTTLFLLRESCIFSASALKPRPASISSLFLHLLAERTPFFSGISSATSTPATLSK